MQLTLKRVSSSVLDLMLSKHLTFSRFIYFSWKSCFLFVCLLALGRRKKWRVGSQKKKPNYLGTVWGKYQDDKTGCGWLTMCILAACSILHTSAAAYKLLCNLTPRVVNDSPGERGIAWENRTTVTWILYFHTPHCCLSALKMTNS